MISKQVSSSISRPKVVQPRLTRPMVSPVLPKSRCSTGKSSKTAMAALPRQQPVAQVSFFADTVRYPLTLR